MRGSAQPTPPHATALQLLHVGCGYLFSFETTLIMLLFAGIYKDDPRFAWMPADVTAVFLLLSVLTGGYLIWRRGIVLVRHGALLLWLYGAIVCWALISMLWSPSQLYAQDKALYLCTLVLWPLATCVLIIAPEPARYRRFFVLLIAFSGWVALESLSFIVSSFLSGSNYAFVEVLSGTYLSLGRVIGPGLVVLAAWAMYIEKRLWARLLLAGMGVGYFAILLSIGGRTPLIAAVLAGLVLLLGTRPRIGRTPHQLLLQLAIAIVICIAVLGIVQSFEGKRLRDLPATLTRTAILFDKDIQSNRRFHHYGQTLQHIENNPWFGQGIGSWPVVVGHGDVRAYPHNIILEIWFELGLPGLALFCALIAVSLAALMPWRKLRTSPFALLALALFINALINAMISGDLNDNRLLFAMLGLMLLAGAANRETTRQNASADVP